jgi:hypothetical protein
MRYESSTVARCPVLCLAIVLCWSSSLSAQAPPAVLTASADSAVMFAGEPLFLTVTIRNISSVKLVVRTDGEGIARIIEGPGGLHVRRDPAIPPGDSGFFFADVAPGAEEVVRLVATETAGLDRPGDYRMRLEYPPLRITGELSFSVKAYAAGAVRARAEEMRDRIISQDDAGGLNEVALTAMDSTITTPILCDILQHSTSVILVPRRLAEVGSARSIECLVNALRGSTGDQREVIESGLRRLVDTLSDGDLRERIRAELSKH